MRGSPSGRNEPLPSVPVAKVAGDWGWFPRMPRCAVGSGRSPEAVRPQMAIAPRRQFAYHNARERHTFHLLARRQVLVGLSRRVSRLRHAGRLSPRLEGPPPGPLP